ncbi:MAG: aminodeoxychorismate synthase component I [Elainellaceae cyanobacterium]
MAHSVFIHDADSSQWLLFEQPHQIHTTHDLHDVIPILQQIEQAVESGYYAAGFISYEASPAFDPAIATHPLCEFPALWFGLYDPPRRLTMDEFITFQARQAYSHGLWTPDVSRPDFDEAIARIKRYIVQGDTFQVNYSFRLHASFHGDAFSFFLDLMEAKPGQYGAFIDLGAIAICSASPELFFSLSGTHLRSKPMKGTAARGLSTEGDRQQAMGLRQSIKDQAENVMVVDMIRNDMGRIAEVGSVQVPVLFETERYPTVWQMTSTITAETSANWVDILQALFPCASITGAPKPRTMDIITELEPSPRNLYTGTIGYLTPHRQAQFNVAIRTVLIDSHAHTAEYGVGSGIVWDSDSQKEYDECRVKMLILGDTRSAQTSQRRPDFSLLETIRWTPHDGYFLMPYHLQRLQNSADYFSIPMQIDAIQHAFENLSQQLSRVPHKIRLRVDQDGHWQLESTPWIRPTHGPVRLRLATQAIDSSNLFLYHKTTHRQVYDDARSACSDCDDVLLWNESGHVTESCIANLVVQIDHKQYTPPICCGLLAGTFRAWLLEQHKIEERVIPREELYRADRLYLINSVRGWQDAMLQL